MRRYLHAFVTALKLSLRGETLQTPLEAWIDEAQRQLEEINRAAQSQQIDPAAFRLRIDRREISMATILQTVEHHLREAYPRLLRLSDGTTLLYAANLDDHFRVTRLEAALPAQSPLAEAVHALSLHLEAVPRAESAD